MRGVPTSQIEAKALIHPTPARGAQVRVNLQGGNQDTAWSVKDNGNLAAQLPRLGFERVKIIELDFTANADRGCTDGAGGSILISASGGASGDRRPYSPGYDLRSPGQVGVRTRTQGRNWRLAALQSPRY
jgi:hypothetical protein